MTFTVYLSAILLYYTEGPRAAPREFALERTTAQGLAFAAALMACLFFAVCITIASYTGLRQCAAKVCGKCWSAPALTEPDDTGADDDLEETRRSHSSGSDYFILTADNGSVNS